MGNKRSRLHIISEGLICGVCKMDSCQILIGVCDRERFWRYGAAVEKAGFQPVYVSEAYDVLNRRLQGRLLCCVYADRRFCSACAKQYDGLLLPGGGDLHPAHFDQIDRYSKGIEMQIDRMQFYLAEAFVSARKPILGICKGMQLLNVLFGGTLCQDLPVGQKEHHAYDSEHEKDRIHGSRISPGFLPRVNLQRELQVNSAHHQAAERLGEGLQAIQWADDGVIEGLCHTSFPVVGFQWHPERCGTEEADFLFRQVWDAMFCGNGFRQLLEPINQG